MQIQLHDVWVEVLELKQERLYADVIEGVPDARINRRIVELVHEAEHGARRNWSGAALLAEIAMRK